jgi:hypothetical protein
VVMSTTPQTRSRGRLLAIFKLRRIATTKSVMVRRHSPFTHKASL